MIHAIELENFKGVSGHSGSSDSVDDVEVASPTNLSAHPSVVGSREIAPGRVRVELAPVTLLFGGNNAGKSSILQSLLYLLEALETGQVDLDRTELGGEMIDLGGFIRMVHRHETFRTVAIRVEFDTPSSLNVFGRALPPDLDDLDDGIKAAWVELRVGVAEGRPPAVERLLVGTPGESASLMELYPPPGGMNWEQDPILAAFNLAHPVLESHAEFLVELIANTGGSGYREGARGEQILGIGFSTGGRVTVIPRLDAPLQVRGVDGGGDDAEPDADPRKVATALAEMLALGIMRQLVSTLRGAIYVGPLRAIPPRSFAAERRAHGRWADGRAAWDRLVVSTGRLVEDTNAWLAPGRLAAGCQLRVQSLVDVSASADAISSGEAAVRRLLLDVGSGTLVLPCEVGAGISQIVPIVVAALDYGQTRLVMLEQPELHIHPALQVRLGDLFITASKTRQFIIETHSEHLVLRLLRRIRETTENELPEGAPPFSQDQLSIVYVESGADGVAVRRLRVDPSGEFLDRWPKGFFEERSEELF